MGTKEREKGKRGERMLAELLTSYGYTARRGQQYAGANGDADVVGIDGIHIECKFVERLNVREALCQSARDARDGEIPTVWHKVSRKPWTVTLYAEDFLALLKEAGYEP